MVRPICLTLAAIFLTCCGAMVQRAISSGPEKPPAGQQAAIADFGDQDSELVMPEAWPHADAAAQPAMTAEPSSDVNQFADPPQVTLPRRPLAAPNNEVRISPRSVQNSISAAKSPVTVPGQTIVPEPWPFEQQVPNRPQRPVQSTNGKVQVNVAPVGSMSPWRQPPVTSVHKTPPAVVDNPVPFPQPLEEETVEPESERTLNAGSDVEQVRQPTLPSASPLNRNNQPRIAHSHLPTGHQQLNADRSAPHHQSNPFRRESLQVISRHASEHVRYGFSLAEKGAVHSAQREFVEALSIIADALDAEGKTSHRAALIAGLRALDEANDFARQDKPLEAAINLRRLVDVHKTPILAVADLATLTPYVAMQQYFAYSEQQLAYAGGRSPAASRALYGLGRIQPFLAGQRGPGNSLGGPKVIALHRAALANDPGNHEAANELGVQLARYGQLPAAAAAFRHSLSVRPVPEAWHNLARVYEEQGEHTQAKLARAQHATLVAAAQQGKHHTGGEPSIRWVDPNVFSPAQGRQHVAHQTSNVKTTAAAKEKSASAKASPGPIQRISRLFTGNRQR